MYFSLSQRVPIHKCIISFHTYTYHGYELESILCENLICISYFLTPVAVYIERESVSHMCAYRREIRECLH